MGTRKQPPTPRERALDWLARREHSARELSRKLLRQGIAADEAEAVVAALRERNLQSDARFAESLVRRRALAGFGPARIKAELAAHGIQREVVAAALAEAAEDWTAIARHALQTRFREQHGDEALLRRKRAAWLMARGFDAATARAVTQAELDPDET